MSGGDIIGATRLTPISTTIQIEQRRELLAACIGLGHPFVDLWLVAINRVGTLALKSQERGEGNIRELAESYLDLLEEQLGDPAMTSARELRRTGRNFALIVDVNFPELPRKRLPELPRFFQSTLGHQVPVGGMFGRINSRMVKQFRMPGYPYVLVTTDVLQEGEDLHTFCSRVIHYGISWTPSSIEQRTGRIDRIGSQTQRRLSKAGRVDSDKLLQVYYPFLRDSVEVVQVRELHHRMNRFIELLHKSLDASDAGSSEIDLRSSILNATGPVLPPRGQLTSAFDIRPEYLPDLPAISRNSGQSLRETKELFDRYASNLTNRFTIDLTRKVGEPALMGTTYIENGRLADFGHHKAGTRRQPFTLALDAAQKGEVIARCDSPVGEIDLRNTALIEETLELQRPHHPDRSEPDNR